MSSTSVIQKNPNNRTYPRHVVKYILRLPAHKIKIGLGTIGKLLTCEFVYMEIMRVRPTLLEVCHRALIGDDIRSACIPGHCGMHVHVSRGPISKVLSATAMHGLHWRHQDISSLHIEWSVKHLLPGLSIILMNGVKIRSAQPISKEISVHSSRNSDHGVRVILSSSILSQRRWCSLTNLAEPSACSHNELITQIPRID